MSHRISLMFGLIVTPLIALAAMGQLPDGVREDVPRNAAPPVMPSDVALPSKLDMDKIDRNAPPFPRDFQNVAPQAPVKNLPVPVYGYIHQFGSFQITLKKADGMFMLTSHLPNGIRSVDFYHAQMRFVGYMVDPDTHISGYVYETNIGPLINDKRYFLFGDQDQRARDPYSNGIRWILYYNGQGCLTYSTKARYYHP